MSIYLENSCCGGHWRLGWRRDEDLCDLSQSLDNALHCTHHHRLLSLNISGAVGGLSLSGVGIEATLTKYEYYKVSTNQKQES